MVMVNQIIHLWGGNRTVRGCSVFSAVLARLQLNSFIARVRMEDSSQEKRQELEAENQEEEGGIRRRLRDRDLLRKRKAEAEEKETNQVESQRKRSRADNRSGAKKRGRPRKTELMPQLSVVQEEAAAFQEAPAVIVAPEPAAVISDQISGSLTSMLAKESQPTSFPAAPALAPVFQSSIFAPTLTYPAPVNSTLDISAAPVQDSGLASASFPVPYDVLAPATTPAPTSPQVLAPGPASSQVLASGPASPQVLAPTPISPQVLAPGQASSQVVAPAPTSPQVLASGPASPRVVAPAPASPQVLASGPTSPQVVAPAPTSPQVLASGPASPRVVAPAPASPQVLAPGSPQVLAPAPAPDAFTLTQDSAPAAVLSPPIDHSNVESIYTESQARKALDQVLIEDLGPDEEEDISPSQDSRDDEGLNETVLSSEPEQTKMYTVTNLSSAPLPRDFFQGN